MCCARALDRFIAYELPLTERSVAVRELPNYAVTRIRAGRFVVNEDGSSINLREREIRFDE